VNPPNGGPDRGVKMRKLGRFTTLKPVRNKVGVYIPKGAVVEVVRDLQTGAHIAIQDGYHHPIWARDVQLYMTPEIKVVG